MLYHSNYNLINGNIITLDKNNPQAHTITIKNHRIFALDASDNNLPTIDLKGACVIPGLVDAHFHLKNLGKRMEMINLKDACCVSEITNMVRQKIDSINDIGVWIQGFGWDQTRWDKKEFPHSSALNQFSNPIALTRIDGHSMWVNDSAMKMAGYNETPDSIEGGKILNECILIDNAMNPVQKVIPKDNNKNIHRWINSAIKKVAEYGITNVHDAWQDKNIFSVINQLASSNDLPIRCYGMLGASDPDLIYNTLGDGYHTNNNYTVRSVKAFIDGALGSRGAALLEPYSDDPHNCGLILISKKDFNEIAETCKKLKIQLCTHAIGDRGNKEVIDTYAKYQYNDYRWRIEHAQMMKYEDMLRCRENNIVPSMQPSHCTSDMRWMNQRIGEHRAHRVSRWKTFVDLGLKIAGGSDCPIEDGNPMFEYYAAVTRQDHKGFPDGGWHSEEKLDRISALKMLTSWAAYGEFAEQKRGKVKIGYDADLSILSNDITTCDSKSILCTTALMNIVGGNIIYSRIDI